MSVEVIRNAIVEKTGKKQYSVDLSFKPVEFPPVNDILIIGNQCPQGKVGLSQCFNLIAPNSFELVAIDEGCPVEAVLINKRLLKKMSLDLILDILRQQVFPHISESETISVQFKVDISIEAIKGVLP